MKKNGDRGLGPTDGLLCCFEACGPTHSRSYGEADRKMDDFRWAEAEKSAAAVASRSGAEKCYRLAATRGTSEFYGSTDRRGGKRVKMRIHSCLVHVSAIPEAELMSAGVLARDASAWSCGTSCGAASASGIAQGRFRQLWTRILMVFPRRLAV